LIPLSSRFGNIFGGEFPFRKAYTGPVSPGEEKQYKSVISQPAVISADINEWGRQCGFEPFNCQVNHFDRECPFEMYSSVLSSFAANYFSDNFEQLHTDPNTGAAPTTGVRSAERCALPSTANIVQLEDFRVNKHQMMLMPDPTEKRTSAQTANSVNGNKISRKNAVVLRDQEANNIIIELQRKLMEVEGNIYKKVVAELQAQSVIVKGFYHVSHWQPFWREVVEEQLRILDGQRQFGNRTMQALAKKWPIPWSEPIWPSLLSLPNSELQVNIVGKSSESELATVQTMIDGFRLKHVSGIRTAFNRTLERNLFGAVKLDQKFMFLNQSDLSEGEFPTINELHKFCTAQHSKGQKAFVYYIHNKGGCCSRKQKPINPVASWREAMNTFVLEYPSVCLRALLEGYAACGYNYAESRPTPHYRYVVT
jgi:hypothetical protein